MGSIQVGSIFSPREQDSVWILGTVSSPRAVQPGRAAGLAPAAPLRHRQSTDRAGVFSEQQRANTQEQRAASTEISCWI